MSSPGGVRLRAETPGAGPSVPGRFPVPNRHPHGGRASAGRSRDPFMAKPWIGTRFARPRGARTPSGVKALWEIGALRLPAQLYSNCGFQVADPSGSSSKRCQSAQKSSPGLKRVSETRSIRPGFRRKTETPGRYFPFSEQ